MDDAPEPIDTSDWPAPGDRRAWVLWRTKKLRSVDPDWQPIAYRLAERGLDPQTILLADLWPEDVAMEQGVAVTAAGDVFGFDFSWLHATRGEGTFTEWTDLTSSWRVDAYPGAAVAAALQIIGEQGGRALNAARRTDPARLRSHVAYGTERLRSVNHQQKPLAADALAERGIDLQTAVGAACYSEREGCYVTFIMTGDGKVFLYDFRFSSAGGSEFTIWKDVTNDPTLDVHERDLVNAIKELAQPT